MLMLISPAKTLHETASKNAALKHFELTQPRLLNQTAKLHQILKNYDAIKIASLMQVSEKIAQLNYARFQQFNVELNANNSYPAIFCFKGDVYEPIEIEEYNRGEIGFIAKHLRILSGFYGLLRPLDLLYPYRLEMGTKLSNPNGSNLYQFWGDAITDLLNEDLKAAQSQYLLNLASAEYFKAINIKKLNGNLINIEFKESKDDSYKIIGIHAKKARGLMVNYLVKNVITNIDSVKNFCESGYNFAQHLSNERNLIFVR
jgi:uncharacterized protein